MKDIKKRIINKYKNKKIIIFLLFFAIVLIMLRFIIRIIDAISNKIFYVIK